MVERVKKSQESGSTLFLVPNSPFNCLVLQRLIDQGYAPYNPLRVLVSSHMDVIALETTQEGRTLFNKVSSGVTRFIYSYGLEDSQDRQIERIIDLIASAHKPQQRRRYKRRK